MDGILSSCPPPWIDQLSGSAIKRGQHHATTPAGGSMIICCDRPSFTIQVTAGSGLVRQGIPAHHRTMSTAAPRPLNVILIGFMGCGKTTVGNLLARQLGFQFIDTDQLIVKKAHRPIPLIFEQEGEAGFRALESAVLEDLAGTDRAVIATGGGIITVPDNVPRLRGLGLVIWLNPPEEILFQRIMRNHDRPLVRTGNPRQTVHDLLTLRRPLYTSAAHLDVDVSDVTPDEAAYGLAESVRVHFAQPLA